MPRAQLRRSRRVVPFASRALTAVPFLALLLLPALRPDPVAAQERHPLDAPSWDEHWTVIDVLKQEGRMDDSTAFSLVLLHPPEKEAAWEWEEGRPAARSLFVVTRRGTITSEAVVDVTNRRLVSWTERPGAQAPWLDSEFGAMTAKVKENPELLEALRRRGITDLQFIECEGGPPGTFGLDEEQGRRLAHVGCWDARYVRNAWTRGIAGLTVVYDMDADSVLRVVDEGAVPVPGTVADYDVGSVGPLRENPSPIRIDQPLGPGFRMDGHRVEWHDWRFHVRPDQRVGMVLSLVRWMEDGRERRVLYEGSLSEIFVPYMDPSTAWYPRNFLDAGEYTAGGLTKPLAQGIDCPENSVYMGMVVVTDDGRPREVPDVICVFERVAGDPSWRHRRSSVEGRPKRDLVVRSAAVLGNYDYLFDWVFQQDGTIRVAVGATGIAESKVVAPENALAARVSMDDGSAGTNGSGDGDSRGGDEGGGSINGTADAYGRFVDQHVVAVNHDHYFAFRLDLDVDGTTNTVRRDRLRTVRLPEDHPRRSLWVVDGAPLRRESEAKLSIDLKRPALWRVTSASATNRNGYPTSYHLAPGTTLETLLTEDDWPRQRAGFIDHHLWVTPYRPDERWAAGAYPTLSRPGQGLPAWTAADRPIESTDVVLWYTMGMHHVVRAEDWPVMPVLWKSFELRPFDFFDRNPALDLPLQR